MCHRLKRGVGGISKDALGSQDGDTKGISIESEASNPVTHGQSTDHGKDSKGSAAKEMSGTANEPIIKKNH
jgi:hypothetical protein